MDGEILRPIELDLSVNSHVAAFSYWNARKPSRVLLPARGSLDPVEMPKTLLPWINLIEVHRLNGDIKYRHRLVGTGIVDMRERDGTGFWFHELYDAARLNRVRNVIDQVSMDGSPRIVRDDLANVGKPYRTMHSLILPLASDGAAVDMLMGVA
jgi:hypothetical protein